MSETDVSMDISERFSLWKEQAKCKVVRHQKRPLCEQWGFPERVRVENFSSEHRLGTESPSCLVSHSQTTCAWQKPSGYVRLVISCLGGRKKRSTRGKGFKNAFLTLNNFVSFSALCNGIMWDSSIKSQTIVWMDTIIMITWAFYSSYSSWKLLTYIKAWRAAWSGSKLIVEWCMYEYVHYGVHLQQSYCLLSWESPQGDEHQRCFLGV